MSLAEILDNTGSLKKSKRLGRGIGSGKGKTAGRGHKGQKSRSGVAIKGFEGGQMPIYRRLPKRGFNNKFSVTYQAVNLNKIQQLINDKKIDPNKVINIEVFINNGVIKNSNQLIKILGNGEIKSKITIELIECSKSAIAKIEKAGGKIINTSIDKEKKEVKKG